MASYKNDWMSSRERFLSALYGGRVDRIPTAALTSVINYESLEALGINFADVHLDPELMANIAAVSYENLGYDTIMPVAHAHLESASLGCDIDWGDNLNWPGMRKQFFFSSPGEVSIPDDFLRRPAMDTVLKSIKILRERYGNKVAIIGKTYGPWSLAYHAYDVQTFLMDTILEPQKVYDFLDALLPASIMSAKAQMEAGADAILWGDHATGDLTSADTYKKFLWPIHCKINKELKFPIILHICGNTIDRLDFIAQSGFEGFHFDSKCGDPFKAKEIVGSRMALAGFVNNPVILMNSTPQEVYQQTMYALEAGVEIAGPECCIPLQTPTINLKTIAKAAFDFSCSKQHKYLKIIR